MKTKTVYHVDSNMEVLAIEKQTTLFGVVIKREDISIIRTQSPLVNHKERHEQDNAQGIQRSVQKLQEFLKDCDRYGIVLGESKKIMLYERLVDSTLHRKNTSYRNRGSNDKDQPVVRIEKGGSFVRCQPGEIQELLSQM